MIEPAGSAIDRLVPELQAGGFKRVKSSNYQEEFKRGDVTVAYSCGRYGEEFMCFVTDADQFRFQMSSYLEIVDPPAASQSRVLARGIRCVDRRYAPAALPFCLVPEKGKAGARSMASSLSFCANNASCCLVLSVPRYLS